MAAQGNEKLPDDKCEDMRCCIRENEGMLSDYLLNSACFPIPIAKDDAFYKQHGVRCLSFIRSEKSSLPSHVQFGEIKNKATGFLDLSLVYGNEESETRKIRSYNGGKLRMNDKNLMAVDGSGDYSEISDRMRATPATSVWPTLFTRNHNLLASELSKVNPKWNDEKVFQEARRLNIAILQSITLDYVNFVFESDGGLNLDKPYDENVDVASTVEFHSAAYRYFHFYVNSNIPLAHKNGTSSSVKFSEIFGNLETFENNFDAVVNGLFQQSINLGVYSNELVNHFARRLSDGVGVDVVSFDIQRGDFGLIFYF
jgi:peroxidase